MSRTWCAVALILLIVILVVILRPEWFGIGPTVNHPDQPPDDNGESVVSSLAGEWAPGDEVPWTVVLPLARISDAVYGEGEILQARLRAWGFDRVDEARNGTMYACVASNDGSVVIAFRGTDELRDWLVNARVLSDPVAPGSLHRGFHRAAQALRAQITGLIAAHGGAKKRIWVTGHSLGAGMAVAFCYGLFADGQSGPMGLVTFGQPLVTDRAGADFLNQQCAGRYLRFIHGNDIVTRVLPTYTHCGDVIWFHDGEFDYRRIAAGASGTADLAAAAPADPGIPPPLTLEEFDDLQETLRQEQRGDSTLSEQGLLGGRTTWLADHRMDGYIHWILKFHPQSARELSRD